MREDQENGKIREESDENVKKTLDEKKLARLRQSHRNYYERNKHWLLEERRLKRLANRKKKPRRKKKPPVPRLSQAELERRKLLRKQKYEAEKAEWNELGWIVAKMNVEAKMNQEQIYEILGGIATKKQISKWCAKGKKMSRIRPIP